MEDYLIDKNGMKKKKKAKKTTIYKILYRKPSGEVIVYDKVFTVYREATEKKNELEKELKGQGYYNFLVYFPRVLNGKNL